MQPWQTAAGRPGALLLVGGLSEAQPERWTRSLRKNLRSSQPNPRRRLAPRSHSRGRRPLKLLYRDSGVTAKVNSAQLLQGLVTSAESVMLASRAGRGRPNATASGRCAGTAKKSRFPAAMQTGKELKQRGKCAEPIRHVGLVNFHYPESLVR